MTLNMGLKQFKSVLPIIRKTGVKFKIQKKAGLPFFFDKYRKRKMFFAGVIFCGAMIYIFSLFIWDIEIQGNSQLTDEVLFDYLGSENVRYGSYKYSVDSDELEKKLREHYDEIIWASVEKKGTRLVVYIQESLLPDKDKNNQNVDNQDVAKSIYSTKEGTVVKMITRKGTPAVSVGAVVSEGGLLVDGKVEITGDDGTVVDTKYCHADADIYIETKYYYEDIFELRHTEKKATGNSRNKYYVTLFSKTFNMYFNKEKYQNQESITGQRQLKLWGDFYLPVFVGKITEKEYETYSTIYDKSAAEDIANEHLQQFCTDLQRKGVQIVEKDVKISIDENSCHAAGYIFVIEKTGEDREISQEEQPLV